MQRPRKDTVAVTALFLTAVGLLVVSVATGLVRPLASTTTCGATITVTRSNVSGHLTVSSATVPVDQCVTFANPTAAPVSLVVHHDGSTVFSVTVPAGATGASGTTYTPRSSGPHSLSASSETAPGTTSTGAATLYVAASPSSSPSATPGSTAPAGKGEHKHKHRHRHHSQRAHHHRSGSKSGAGPRRGVGGAAVSNGGLPTGLVTPSLPGSPGVSPRQPPESDPVVAPQPTTPVVVPTTSAPAATLLSGPIEPAEDNSRGLPTAVAVVVLIGLALGWGRVVLSTSGPVDKRPRGDHRL